MKYFLGVIKASTSSKISKSGKFENSHSSLVEPNSGINSFSLRNYYLSLRIIERQLSLSWRIMTFYLKKCKACLMELMVGDVTQRLRSIYSLKQGILNEVTEKNLK